MAEKSEKTVLQKLMAVNSKPTAETFPELPDALVWLRAGLAVAYACWLGMSTMATEGAGLLMGINLITFVPFIFCSTYLGANTDSFGNQILTAGTFNALALLLLIWIWFFTANHESEENAIIAALKATAPIVAEEIFEPEAASEAQVEF
ncbi:unnamed protein product [Cylindrotheca closterium]|uniref:Uncharacterized protein n=1 Tax=Cylindrotheca closterium TaxID=2856 RepID=A0AAD2CH27_9STRA|nr:unnamed protein product [Cylindrotheca closterium]